MIETFTTENSVYEIDYEGKRARRVKGKNDPTDSFIRDGRWREYEEVTDTLWGGKSFLWPDGIVTYTTAGRGD